MLRLKATEQCLSSLLVTNCYNSPFFRLMTLIHTHQLHAFLGKFPTMLLGASIPLPFFSHASREEEATVTFVSSSATARHLRRSERRKASGFWEKMCVFLLLSNPSTELSLKEEKNPVFWKFSVFLLQSTGCGRRFACSLKEQQHGFSWKMLVFVLPTSCCCPVDGGLQQQLPILSCGCILMVSLRGFPLSTSLRCPMQFARVC